MNVCSLKSIIPFVIDGDVNCTAFRNAFGANGQDAVACFLSGFRHIAVGHKSIIVTRAKLSAAKLVILVFWGIVAEDALPTVPVIGGQRHVFQQCHDLYFFWHPIT